jgi:putative flippase GtrA
MRKERLVVKHGFLGHVGNFLNYTTSLGGRASVTFTRFLRFGTSSSFTLMIDIIFLVLLVEVFLINYLVAAGLSFAISTSMNYLINREWGFRGTTTSLLNGYFIFLFFSLFGIGITVGLMWFFVGLLGLYYILARVIVAIIEGTLTFLANNSYTFKMPKHYQVTDYFSE